MRVDFAGRAGLRVSLLGPDRIILYVNLYVYGKVGLP